jgi:hypothetical protein
MAAGKAKGLFVFVGTKKGAFLLRSDRTRKRWALQGPFLKGGEVNDIMLDTRSGPVLHACVKSYWWGANIHFSKDFGKT